MISQEANFWPRMARFILVTLIVFPTMYAQDKQDNLALRVPHTSTHIPIDCSDTSVLWEKVPRVSLSKEAVVDVPADSNLRPVLNAMKPIAAIVQMKDPANRLLSFLRRSRASWTISTSNMRFNGTRKDFMGTSK